MEIKYMSGKEVEEQMGNDLTIVVLFATWCGPCKMFHSVLEEVAKENYKIWKVDIDQNQDFAEKYQCSGVPATLIFRNKKFVNHFEGYLPKEEVLKKINEK